jgi:predicted N-acyltransferase
LPSADTEPLVVRDDVAIEAIPPADWDRFAAGQPLASHAFLTALHATGCATSATGWQPHFVTAWRGKALAGALPLYAKAHSYGEYVFDWAWADAFRRHGYRYYPKLVASIPFTPTPGARLLAHDDAARDALLARALARLRPTRSGTPAPFSSLHILFPDATDAARCERAGMTLRRGVQFRWSNSGYRDFSDFLASFTHDKRKKIRQERRKLADNGLRFVRMTGREITPADWRFFYRCYEGTYHAHHSTPYLSLDFFLRIAAAMPENLLLVLGYRDGAPLCAALDVYDSTALWGRYWGAQEYVPGLHFEACYYQAIEFCIERRIATFEGGAQGPHKLARGLLPAATYSAHAIADPDFAAAIADFCQREQVEIAHIQDELAASSPFRT